MGNRCSFKRTEAHTFANTPYFLAAAYRSQERAKEEVNQKIDFHFLKIVLSHKFELINLSHSPRTQIIILIPTVAYPFHL